MYLNSKKAKCWEKELNENYYTYLYTLTNDFFGDLHSTLQVEAIVIFFDINGKVLSGESGSLDAMVAVQSVLCRESRNR